MSKLCIAVFNDFSGVTKLKKQISHLLASQNLGVFFELSNDEPALSRFQSDDVVFCSLSDNFKVDNCEMLLLPDNCFSNGEQNTVPFQKRMKQIESVIKIILDSLQSVELFIGDSGVLWDEYTHYDIIVDDFLYIASSLNSTNQHDLHFTIRQ